MMPRAAAINIDVDSLYLYYRLHGLDERRASGAVWERGVPRFAELLSEVGVKATFFVVASDLERWPAAADIARQLVRDGHELANHTWSHPYDLTRWPRTLIELQLDRARKLITEVRGQPVSGFRAPGYTMSDVVYELLAAKGYAYGSSIFPCPPYYLAKAAMMALMRLRGKRSHAILDHPRIMWANPAPHLTHGMVELPITVLPGVRFPLIGTSLLMIGARGYRLSRPLWSRLPFVNLELHGIDLCDRERDGMDPALTRQPDLRVPLATKRALFRQVFTDLRDRWGVSTLEELAPRHAAALRGTLRDRAGSTAARALSASSGPVGHP